MASGNNKNENKEIFDLEFCIGQQIGLVDKQTGANFPLMDLKKKFGSKMEHGNKNAFSGFRLFWMPLKYMF